MRIVSGVFRGRNLVPFDCNKIRPTSDMARESFFNIMQSKVAGCRFIDLFCGTGAMGIEALSRGAKYAALNDLNAESLAVTKKNLDKLGNPSGAEIFRGDGVAFLYSVKEPFDIIYADPPYKSELNEAIIKAAAESAALKDNGILALETETPYNGETFGLTITDRRKYGRVHITFFKKEEK